MTKVSETLDGSYTFDIINSLALNMEVEIVSTKMCELNISLIFLLPPL